ncbi:MAG TPA: two-component sensor histidine kinase, partial [Rudaea sp.]|nr:two-component sensor histidine kinase [Rudaea sp.]
MNSATIARPRTDPALRDIDRRELYFFNLFRVLQAFVITGLMFSPLVTSWVRLDHPLLGRLDGIVYLLVSGYALLRTEHWRHELRFKVAAMLTLDIAATTIALFALANPPSAIAMLLLVNIGAGALLLPPRQAGFFAALATLCVIGQSLASRAIDGSDRNLIEYGLYGLSYFA